MQGFKYAHRLESHGKINVFKHHGCQQNQSLDEAQYVNYPTNDGYQAEDT